MSGMIDVQRVITDVPAFDKFCSVEKLNALADSLRTDSRFVVRTAGKSAGGRPIHHVRSGKGPVKALIVAGPHAPEVICSLTVYSLLTLLKERHPALRDAPVEWHIVPCIDPDAAILNEGWTQQPFSLKSFMQHFFVQAPRDQVDLSFPVAYKKLRFEQPSAEASVLRQLLDEIRPDFYFSLHNSFTGGAFFYLTRDIGEPHYRRIYELLNQLDFPLLRKPIWSELSHAYSESIVESFSITKYYDYLEKTSSNPEEILKGCGMGSYEYLQEIKPEALTCVVEMGYVHHPDTDSEVAIGVPLRQLTLRVETENKFLATVILEEWEKTRADLDVDSPFYRSLTEFFLPSGDRVREGGIPLARFPTSNILFGPEYDKTATAADRFNACIVDGGFMFVLPSFQFVRLLKASKQTPAVLRAIDRLERTFDQAMREISRHVDFGKFQQRELRTLARVQLGSGLIALNAVLEGR